MQRATRENGGVGIQLYDGVGRTGGAIARLGSRTNAGGASSRPSVVCRNAANVCTSGTANPTNGWEITWRP